MPASASDVERIVGRGVADYSTGLDRCRKVCSGGGLTAQCRQEREGATT